MAVWGAHHRDVRPDPVEANDAIHGGALDRCLSFEFESELSEERARDGEVVNDDAHMMHPLDRHLLDHSVRPSSITFPERPRCRHT